MNWLRQRPFLAPILTFAVLLHSPWISGQRTRPTPELTSRQQVEIVFQNGVRNARRRDDLDGQMRAIEKALTEIKTLRSTQRGLSKADEAQVSRRTRQLQRMLASKTTDE